ncbi:hypothetical protein [Ralstonia sp. SET104]|uniref:hypothetical protein n=1 Tax=Ralstonia sp. SET104 TaxID=2448774 RepID=UPI000F57B1F0|nr:hypothetical protein [Ralstonia sp. SET104]GCB04821.1 hypothetical protein PSUB009319_24520 [Ralstonia sp. SET104]
MIPAKNNGNGNEGASDTSTQQMAQTLDSTYETNTMLQQFKAIATQHKLPSPEIKLAVEQIIKWDTLRKNQLFIEETLNRANQSPMPERNNLHVETRKIENLKYLNSEIALHFDTIQNTKKDEEFSKNVIVAIHKIDKKVYEMEMLQKHLLPGFEKNIKLIKDNEALRRSHLEKEIEKTMKRAGEREARARANGFGRENPATRQIAQANEMQQIRAQIDLRRHQNELQPLRAPWPEKHPSLCVGVEAPQPGPSAGAKARTSPAFER